MGEDSGEKTEQPTPNKLSEAKKKGQVSKSKDFTSVVVLIVSYFSLKVFAPFIFRHMDDLFRLSFTQIGLDFSNSIAVAMLGKALEVFAIVVIPLFFINLLAVVIVEFLQVGAVFTFATMEPELSKLNPIEGAKKLVSLKQFVELIKSVIKMTVVIAIIVFVLIEDLMFVFLAQELTLMQTVTIGANLMFKIVIRVGIIYLVIALLDMFYQRYEYIKGLMMSKKEVKDEYKKLEGDPIIKQRQRDAQRQMAQGRQMGAVPEADVVVTNPVYIAIAIQYVPNKMQAPKVLAKGKRLIASGIRKIAEEHYIPIVQNPTLARNLYATTEVGSDVPPVFYKAVAEILAFVYNLKKKKNARF